MEPSSDQKPASRQPQRGRVGQTLHRWFRTPWLPEDHPVNRRPTWHYILILAIMVPAGIGGVVMIVMYFVTDGDPELPELNLPVSVHVVAAIIGVLVAAFSLTLPGREEEWPLWGRVGLAVVTGVLSAGLVYAADGKYGPLY